MTHQSSLFEYAVDLSALSPAQREVYEAIEQGDYGMREYARETGRSPGTVGNLLERARRRLDGGEAR